MVDEEYLEEINTALSVRDTGYYFDSISDVTEYLEIQREEYDRKASNHKSMVAGLSGSGIVGMMYPEFYSAFVSSPDEMASLGLLGGLTLSAVPGLLAKSNIESRDEIDDLITMLEEEENIEDTELAYRIADTI